LVVVKVIIFQGGETIKISSQDWKDNKLGLEISKKETTREITHRTAFCNKKYAVMETTKLGLVTNENKKIPPINKMYTQLFF
jgi:hypothetical protein